MAREYLKVLKALQCDVLVAGRDAGRARGLAEEFGYASSGGGTQVLKDVQAAEFDWAINAVSIESLFEISMACMEHGLHRILVEKPGAFNRRQLEEILSKAGSGDGIRIAFNRRFYNSVLKLEERAAADGGIVGCFFDFTDREKDVIHNPRNGKVVARWGWCNAIHVIDTAFHLIGPPLDLTASREGSWPAHPSGTVFAGSGRTGQCLYSYFATWSGGGRWNVEVSTSAGRYRLSPLEELAFCRKNQFAWESVPLGDNDDDTFKPGMFKMVRQTIIEEDFSRTPGVAEQVELCRVADRIFGYDE